MRSVEKDSLKKWYLLKAVTLRPKGWEWDSHVTAKGRAFHSEKQKRQRPKVKRKDVYSGKWSASVPKWSEWWREWREMRLGKWVRGQSVEIHGKEFGFYFKNFFFKKSKETLSSTSEKPCLTVPSFYLNHKVVAKASPHLVAVHHTIFRSFERYRNPLCHV